MWQSMMNPVIKSIFFNTFPKTMFLVIGLAYILHFYYIQPYPALFCSCFEENSTLHYYSILHLNLILAIILPCTSITFALLLDT